MNNTTKEQVKQLDNVMSSSPVFTKVKTYIQNSIGWTAIFVFIFVAALFSNGYFNTHFDLDALITFYGVVYAKQVVNYGINSTLNSPKGELPDYIKK